MNEIDRGDMSLNRAIMRLQFTDRMGTNFEFNNLKQLKEFIDREMAYWQEVKGLTEQNKKINIGTGNLRNIQNVVADALVNTWEDNELNERLRDIFQSQRQYLSAYWLYSGHEYADKVVTIMLERGYGVAGAFLEYLNNKVQPFNSKDAFDGALLAYEYQYQNSDLVKRRGSERATLTRLKEQFAAKSAEITKKIDENQQQYDKNQEQFTEWFDQSVHNVDEQLERARLKFLGRNAAFGRLAKKESKKYHIEMDEHISSWQNRINELEQTYQDKLRLAKPAEYWKQSANKYRVQGFAFVIAIGILVLVAITTGLDLFQAWLLGGETALSVKTVPGMVLFGSLVAVFGFALRALNRLAFSTFHLMRDAEEREQLTYLYLSLSNESAIDKESRDIILQALFCRTETGLLSQDSGPTMPGFGDAIKEMTKAK